MSRPTPQTHKGIRGFELDLHVAFQRPLSEAEALAALHALPGLNIVLYRPHPSPTRWVEPSDVVLPSAPIPSARLTGTLGNAQEVRAALAELLLQQARSLEVGLRGFLRSGSGQTEWMPWRKNVVLERGEVEQVRFEEGVKYILD